MLLSSRILYGASPLVLLRHCKLTPVATKQLGDCLGRGAFGSVYRALNWNTGETVAVKQIKLADLPKSELRVIMVNIKCYFTIHTIVADSGVRSWKLIS